MAIQGSLDPVHNVNIYDERQTLSQIYYVTRSRDINIIKLLTIIDLAYFACSHPKWTTDNRVIFQQHTESTELKKHI